MSGFAALQPALTAQLTFDPPCPIGKINSGSQLFIASIQPGGSVKSEPGFSPAFDAEFVFGSDHFTLDSTGGYVNIDVKAALRNADGAFVSYSYTGTIEINAAFGLILAGSPHAKTTEYGQVFTHVNFETGAEHLKALETSKFVGTSRFVVEEGKSPMIEMKISKIVKG